MTFADDRALNIKDGITLYPTESTIRHQNVLWRPASGSSPLTFGSATCAAMKCQTAPRVCCVRAWKGPETPYMTAGSFDCKVP